MATWKSAQVEVDLHILVVPESHWRPDLRLAYSSTCMASVSAGFVRVDPDVSLDGLREEISRQLDSSSLPSSYIFLRSVGRYLCRVSTNQELSLTSKLFAPPLAPCPEIYLLNADLANEPHGTPPHTLPKLYYSPQTSGQLPNIYPTLTSTPTLTHSYSQPVHEQRAALHKEKPVMSLVSRQNSLDTSDKNGKLGAMLRDGGYGSTQKQPHANTTTLGYQPQDDNELYGDQLHKRNVDDNPLGGSSAAGGDDTVPRESDHCEKSRTPKKRVQKVHFESLTNLKEADSNSSAFSYSYSSRDDESAEKLFPSRSQCDEVHILLAQLRKVKEESKHLNTLKESLSNTVRQLQYKLKAHKEKDDNEWRQKLSKEKKQTRHLEKSIQKLKSELKDVDRAGKMKEHSMKTAKNDRHKESVEKSESNHTNLKLECKRADVDMETLRRTLEEERRKFKLEQEKHQSIIDECKAFKKKLAQAKIANSRSKKRM